jgi:hypothetical protein
MRTDRKRANRIESKRNPNPNAWVRGSIRVKSSQTGNGRNRFTQRKRKEKKLGRHHRPLDGGALTQGVDARAGEEPAAPPSVTTERHKGSPHNSLDLSVGI